MSVIAELTLPADEFELGRILAVEDPTSIVLETMVPMGERPVPFFRLHDDVRSTFEAAVREHPAVDYIQPVDSRDDEALYALDWQLSEDSFFQLLVTSDVTLLEATGTADAWDFELRFPTHEALSAFRERCADADVSLEVVRVYRPTNPDAGPWFGLTAPQREALTLAVREGYYSIPRQISTKELADVLDISDQALTERLRRAIVALTTNTVLLSETDA